MGISRHLPKIAAKCETLRTVGYVRSCSLYLHCIITPYECRTVVFGCKLRGKLLWRAYWCATYLPKRHFRNIRSRESKTILVVIAIPSSIKEFRQILPGFRLTNKMLARNSPIKIAIFSRSQELREVRVEITFIFRKLVPRKKHTKEI